MVTEPVPNASAAAFELSAFDLMRVCRDLAWNELALMPGMRSRLGPRLPSSQPCEFVDWSSNGLALDSLGCMDMATAASVWCNAYDAAFEDLFLAKRNVADWAEAMHRARNAGATGFTFSTSGSTGKPQFIRHDQDSLVEEANSWAQVLLSSASAVSRIVTLVPCHHIYGFIWGVLLPRALGVPVLDASHEALPELLDGDLLVAVPDQWQWLASSSRAEPVRVQGVTSTSPISSALHVRLVTAQGAVPARLTRLLQIYGSTQTGGVAWRDGPQKPYTLAPGRSRSAGGGVELVLPSGALVPLALQDEVVWTSLNQFDLLGRTDSCVQVGGHNVSTNWVAQQLSAYPSVQEVSVRLDTSASLPRLKAFVVLRAPADDFQKASLQSWALETLPWYAALSSITYGKELPRNVMGKPSDWLVQNSTIF